MFNWQETDTLTFALRDDSQVRLTFATCSEYDFTRFQAAANRVATYFRDVHNADIGDATNAVFLVRNATPEQRAVIDNYYSEYNRLLDWSAVLASLRKIETRASEDSEWVEIETPNEFLHPQTALRVFPPHVIGAAVDMVNDLNPGVFTNSSAAKKVWRLIDEAKPNQTETPSTNGAKRSSKRKSEPNEKQETISQA